MSKISPFKKRARQYRRVQSSWIILILLLMLAAGLLNEQTTHIERGIQDEIGFETEYESETRENSYRTITCENPRITDGDTFRCGGHRIRLQGIDAPEMDGHCIEGRRCVDGDPIASRDYLIELTRGTVTCRAIKKDHYGRIIALCETPDGYDISCEMVDAGYAEQRYAPLDCE